MIPLRLQRGAEYLHGLGPRATAEFLAEIGIAAGCLPLILGRLAEYERRLDPVILRRVGGDRFPSRALLAVPE